MQEPTISMQTDTFRRHQPELEKQNSVSVGDNMYTEFYEKVTKHLYTKTHGEASAEMDFGAGFLSIKASVPTGSTNQLRVISGTKTKATCFPGTAADIIARYDACLVDQDDDGMFDHVALKMRYKYFPLKENVKYEIIEAEASKVEMPDLKVEVLYQGLNKGSIKISFREFMKDIARPAFTQDISYDLSPSGTTEIAFKELRIEVIKATSTGITYKVLKPLH